ncbi:IS1/IS1595 family N-terminal zinc-binding domain-containing protein [Psychroflexus planctonicus]|uniref:Transposase n=1 Tax=Psychroflexus planctonicus TaxID=1526575 RepID=A0ABQ1SJX1_9FLAO|nr:helix-turn-helix domain-containing protein [Psychroflexus planctonicus]GGE43665.1 transposase [Psychroflexus planctonicus]
MKYCPQCQSTQIIKSGILNDRQRYKCKSCGYNFTVNKLGKQIDKYYVTKALQLYLEGLTYREIERIIGVSHVSVMNWVRKYNIHKVQNTDYHPTYKILSQSELASYFSKPENTKGAGMIVTELGDKYMVIKWERFKE